MFFCLLYLSAMDAYATAAVVYIEAGNTLHLQDLIKHS